MTDEESAIWRATYASAFVSEARALREAGAEFDRAMDGTGEVAITIADQAIRELRYWRENEEPNAGKTVEPNTWYEGGA